MTSYYYGDIFDLNNQIINIHDLNLMNNIRKNKVSFNTLSPLKQVLANIDEPNRDDYFENGISINEENKLKSILDGSSNQILFNIPTDDVMYLTNVEQNQFTLNMLFDGNMLQGQFAKINFIQFYVNGIDIDSIYNINENILTWNISNENNLITISSPNGFFIPNNTQIYNLFEIKYQEPIENWDRQIRLSNVIIKSSIVEHYILNDKILNVPPISGGNVYNFQALNYLASSGYTNENTRIKPVNHSQQDNMFVIYSLENENLKTGDIIFVIDDHLFGETNKYKIRNYLCGWSVITNENINNVKYIAIYIDHNSDTGNTVSNVKYKYKYYDSGNNTIYDLETQEGTTYKSLGHGSVQNPVILTKSNISLTVDEINEINIYNLLLEYL